MIALLVITILSLAVAAVMSVVAWRLAREERRRSEARVEALTAEIHADEPPLVKVGDYLPPEAPARTQGSLFGALAIGVLFVGSVVGLAIVFSDGARNSSVATPVAMRPGRQPGSHDDRPGAARAHGALTRTRRRSPDRSRCRPQSWPGGTPRPALIVGCRVRLRS